MSQAKSPLAAWLIQACQERGLSWAEASRRAGLSQGAISAIVRGTQPGLEICKALANYFGVPAEEMLRLAGHLPPARGSAWPPELAALVREVESLPPPLQRATLRAWRAVLEGIQASRQSSDR
jgi:transcriptional regulator with XRE-family HTH domain